MGVQMIDFSDGELASGHPLPETIERIVECFTRDGAVRVGNLFDAEFLQRLRGRYYDRYRFELSATDKQDRRPLYSVDLEGPVADARYFANPLLFPAIKRILGEEVTLGAVSTVISFPGAPEQFKHRDSDSLFGDFNVDVQLPTYALTMLVPMVDANAETGSTRVWPGSHREPAFERACAMPSESPDVPHGCVMLTDSRVLHCGSPNVSDRIRPLLYNSYHRSWFRDWGGYEYRPPVNVTPSMRRALADHAPLFRIADETAGQPEGGAPSPVASAALLAGGFVQRMRGRLGLALGSGR